MRFAALRSCALLTCLSIASAAQVLASSLAPIQLQGVKKVQISVSFTPETGLVEETLKRQIIQRLERSGLTVEQYRDQKLEVIAIAERVPDCDLLAIWVSVRLRDQVSLTRHKALDLRNHPAIIWLGEDRGFSNSVRVTQEVTEMLLSEVDHFVDAVSTVARLSGR
jgi:hypothetical protein